MLFRPRATAPIVIEPNQVHSTAPEVAGKLDRIARNYEQFERVFSAIECKLTLDLPLVNVDLEASDSADVHAPSADISRRRRKPR